MRRITLIIAMIIIAVSMHTVVAPETGQQASFSFDLTTEAVHTLVCTPYDFTVVLGNTAEVPAWNISVWVLFKEYGTGPDEATESGTGFDWYIYNQSHDLEDSGTGTGLVHDVAVGNADITPNFPGNRVYKAFNASIPSHLHIKGGYYLVIVFKIHSAQAGDVKLLAYAYGQDPSSLGIVHNSLDKNGDGVLSLVELTMERNQKGVSVTVDDYQRSTVPALPIFAIPGALGILGGIRWIKKRRQSKPD